MPTTDTTAAAAELADLRTGLQVQLERLGAAVVVATHADGDEADLGTAALERDHNAAQIRTVRARLATVVEALARIDAGTYGTCTVCGGPVGAERLEALPATPTCRDCTTA